jgi:hypothetical protein
MKANSTVKTTGLVLLLLGLYAWIFMIEAIRG